MKISVNGDRTRGVWKDQAAFERIAQELSIETDIVERGISAILEAMSSSSNSTIVPLLLGGLILNAFGDSAEMTNRGISEHCRVIIRATQKKESFWETLLFCFSSDFREDSFPNQLDGKITEQSLALKTSTREISLSTRLISKVELFEDGTCHVEFLDSTFLKGKIINNIITFMERGTWGFDPTQVHHLSLDQISSIRCLPI